MEDLVEAEGQVTHKWLEGTSLTPAPIIFDGRIGPD
jgi:hypothetical protein